MFQTIVKFVLGYVWNRVLEGSSLRNAIWAVGGIWLQQHPELAHLLVPFCMIAVGAVGTLLPDRFGKMPMNKLVEAVISALSAQQQPPDAVLPPAIATPPANAIPRQQVSVAPTQSGAPSVPATRLARRPSGPVTQPDEHSSGFGDK